MSKLSLNHIASGYRLSQVNSNFTKIEDILNDRVLFRNNVAGEPNSMVGSLDMNGQAILNAGSLSASSLVLNGQSLEPGDAVAAATLQTFEFVAVAGQTSFSVTPLIPLLSSLMVEVNGIALPLSRLGISGSVIIFPALELGDEAVIRVFTRDIGGLPSAAQITFLRSLPGAVTRTLADKVSETFSVKDFGAIGNGVVDDTAAINACIAATVGGLTGARVYFPAGIYKVTSSINCLNKSNLFLSGDGPNVSVIRPTGAMAKCVVFGTGPGTAHQGIDNLTIDCQFATSCIAVETAYCAEFWFDRVNITSASVGLNIIGGYGQYVTNFNINQSIQAAIKLGGVGNDVYICRGIMSSFGFTEPTKCGIWVDNYNGIWIDSVDTIAQRCGLLIEPLAGVDILWMFVSNSAFDSGLEEGIRINPQAGARVLGANFVGTWTASNTLSGLLLTGAGEIDGCRFTGHRSYRNKQSGYTVAAGGVRKGLAFVSSEASGNSWMPSGLYSGFDIGGGVGNFTIADSKSGAIAGQANTQNRGILINPGASDNYTIVNTDCRDNVNASILDLGTGANKHIFGCLGYSTATKGTGNIAVAAVFRVVTHGLASTPTAQDISVTLTSNPVGSGTSFAWVTNITSTTFTVNTNATVATTPLTFSWQARTAGA